MRLWFAGGGVMRAWLIVVLGAVGCGAGPEAEGPTWHQDVAPIVYEHCASCHQADQIGPIDLTEYANAAPWGPAMAAETAAATTMKAAFMMLLAAMLRARCASTLRACRMA